MKCGAGSEDQVSLVRESCSRANRQAGSHSWVPAVTVTSHGMEATMKQGSFVAT